jgi:hypothetical protein
MDRLDCSSRKAAFQSVAHIAGVTEADLWQTLVSCSDDHLLAEARFTGRTVEDVLARHVLGQSVEEFSPPREIVWFHGTRLSRETNFSMGLLPLKKCLPHLEYVVEQLAREVGVTIDEIQKGERSASHVTKLALIEKIGPYGSLFREVGVHPTGAHGDFLDSPEIVCDLARSIGGARAEEILDLYRLRAARCVVWFIGREPRSNALTSAIKYVHAIAQNDDEPGHSNTCFDGHGQAVPSADIVKVEWLDG